MSTLQKQPVNSFRPKKSLGQNFLVDKSVIDKICKSSDLKSSDEVIEIGPGKGALTGELLRTVKKLYAVEKDDFLFSGLRKKYSHAENLELINEDALEMDFKSFGSSRKLKLISNLPYNITSPVIDKLTYHRNLFSEIIIMIQKEVGERIVSTPGRKNYGSLSVMVQTYFDITKVCIVPPTAFRPRPKVESVVIKLLPTNRYLSDIKNEETYKKVVKSSFSSRRKMLGNSLRSGFCKEDIERCLLKTGISGKRRAETLGIPEFISMANGFYELQHSTSSSSSSF